MRKSEEVVSKCADQRHLVRRGAGAEDEVLGEAVPAEDRVRAIADESCEEQSRENPRRHSSSSTHFGARHFSGWLEPEWSCSVLPRPGAVYRGNERAMVPSGQRYFTTFHKSALHQTGPAFSKKYF